MKRSIAVLALLLACGSPTLRPGDTRTCTATLSGALGGTYDCRPASVVWSSSTDIFGFAFSLPGSGSSPAIAVAVGFGGEPHTGHYTGADSGVQGGAAATRGSSSWSTASFDLNLTSVTNATAITSGKGYSTDGTFDATLAAAPESGASGTVTMHVVF